MRKSKQNDIFEPSLNSKTNTGTIERITFQNEETNYVVARFRLEDTTKNLITIVGSLPSVVEGQRIRIEGKWLKHPKFGYQFQVQSFATLIPVTKKGIELYLGSGMIRGIGPVYAKNIVNKFGLDTIQIIDEDPDQLLEVDGIGEKRFEIIKDAWASHQVVREIMVFLAGHNISPTYALKIFKEYGTQTLNVLRKNPYQLADDVFGIGFLTADKIAKNIGVSENEPARIEAGIKYILSQGVEQGHLFVSEDELIQSSSEILGIKQQQVEKVCLELFNVGHLINDNGAVYLASYFHAEKGLAERLIELKAAPSVNLDASNILHETQKLVKLQGIEYNQKQNVTLTAAIQKKILVITGGPGTGKTTVIKGIIQLFEYLGQRVYLTAPTGRASKRLSEATVRKAQTIHRLLEYEPKEHVFKRNQKYPLKADVIIVDEVSMVDSILANHLVKAVPLNARLILVGDVDQLPSVGAGNVLRDIIDSGLIATIHLDEIFRQATDSQIIFNAHQINHGLLPELIRKNTGDQKKSLRKNKRLIPRDDFGDFLFVQEELPEKIVQMIQELCEKKLPERYGYLPKRDIQILTPMYRGELGADNLNKILQESLNPESKKISRGQTEFRVGDRVMQIRNNYDKKVFNGDLGFIRQIDLDEQKMVVLFDNMVTFEFSELDELVLAYAITVHKSQGSEYPVIIMPITTQHYMMLQRNLLYTAITRAKELIVLIGTKKSLAIAVRNNRVVQRNTKLAKRLNELVTH